MKNHKLGATFKSFSNAKIFKTKLHTSFIAKRARKVICVKNNGSEYIKAVNLINVLCLGLLRVLLFTNLVFRVRCELKNYN